MVSKAASPTTQRRSLRNKSSGDITPQKSSTKDIPDAVGGSKSVADRRNLIASKKPVITFSSNSDDEVEEYQFSSDDDTYDTNGYELDDVQSVITLSSESSTTSDLALPSRPWVSFEPLQREQYEYMYANATAVPIGGSWEITEDYQREKDAEMLRYMEDYPLNLWVIPQDLASQAYFRLLERSRWRSLGLRIYERARPPEHVFNNVNVAPVPTAPKAQHERHPQEQVPPISPLNQPFGHMPPPPLPQHSHNQQHQIPPQLLPPSQQVLPHGLPSGLPHFGPFGQPVHVSPGLNRSEHHVPPRSSMIPTQHYAAYPAHISQPAQGAGRVAGQPSTTLIYPLGYAAHMPLGDHQTGRYSSSGGFRPSNSTKTRRGREKKESPAHLTPPPPPPTPPYAVRQKPAERKGNKSTRRNARRQAEAEEFPWTRKLDFPEEKEKAKWDDSIYDTETLKEMDIVRALNVSIIGNMDAHVQEQQRTARLAKKQKEQEAAPAEETEDESKDRRKSQRGQRKGESGGDPYHSGAFAFASAEDEKRAMALGVKSPDEAIEAAEEGVLDSDAQATLKICWNPGKKGMTESLEQVKFSIKDTIATREQLKSTVILTRRAAECIIDFCPDMLWRGMLLRICSEGGYGNKDVRDRFCYNGCYCDKATITKRISAALGQKQQQPKSKGYSNGEWEWYEENVKDFAKYIDYFGKRSTHRNTLKIQMQGERRRAKMQEMQEQGAQESDNASGRRRSAKRRKTGNGEGKETTSEATSAVEDADADVEMEQDGERCPSEESDDSDAVSMQDSDVLDKMEE